MHFPKDWYTHIKHNEGSYEMVKLMNGVSIDESTEPSLKPLQRLRYDNKSTTREYVARLDVKADRLWQSRSTRRFSDVKMFNPHAKSGSKSGRILSPRGDQKNKNKKRVVEWEKSTFRWFFMHWKRRPTSHQSDETTR